jgi:heptosyltransferase-2
MKTENILLVLVAGVGDLLIASAALKALRKRHPKSRITLMVEKRSLAYAGTCPYVDEVLALEATPSSPPARLGALRDYFITALKLSSRKYDVAVNMFEVATTYGDAKMKLLFNCIGAETSIGRSDYKRGTYFDLKVPELPGDTKTQGEYYAELAALLGADALVEDKTYWLSDRARAAADSFLAGSSGPLIGINATSARVTNHWLDERFAAVADALAEKLGGRAVLFGSPSDRSKCDAIASLMKNKPLIVAGELELEGSLAVVPKLKIMVTIHSAMMHAANACGVPFVGLLSVENSVKDGPYHPVPGRFALLESVPADAPRPQKPCMENITVEAVLSAAEKLLK